MCITNPSSVLSLHRPGPERVSCVGEICREAGAYLALGTVSPAPTSAVPHRWCASPISLVSVACHQKSASRQYPPGISANLCGLAPRDVCMGELRHRCGADRPATWICDLHNQPVSPAVFVKHRSAAICGNLQRIQQVDRGSGRPCTMHTGGLKKKCHMTISGNLQQPDYGVGSPCPVHEHGP